MVNEVFITYSTIDRKIAKEIVNYIEKNGYDCFIANRDISGGNHYAKNIVNVIDGCKAVILIASSNSNVSEHVLNEIDICVEKKKTIIPFVIDDFEMNDEFRYYLGRSQRVMVTDSNIIEALPRLLDAVKREYPKEVPAEVHQPAAKAPADEAAKKTKTIFEYDADRGIMINPEDRMRNVSFRQDTFILMMKDLYESIAKGSGEEVASETFYNCGYECGTSFGNRLNEMLNSSKMPLEEKLHKWCEFDSSVGWGKFNSNVRIDIEEGQIEGTFGVNENFYVDKKGGSKVCEYIRGYCTGVMEMLLGGVEVRLTCTTCPIKNKFKTECVFNVELK